MKQTTATVQRRAALILVVALALLLPWPGTGTAHAGTTTINASDDVYSSQSNPTGTHGSDASINVNASATAERRSHVKFAVTGIPAGATNIVATLKLYSQQNDTSTVYTVSNEANTWSEGTLTWNNQPALGSTVTTKTGLTTSTYNSWTVSSAVTGNGTYAFAVRSSSTTQQFFDSKENTGVKPPQLALTWTDPAPTNTAPVVNAGPDVSVTLPNAATLAGSVTDDGLPNPPAAATATWSQVSGPGTTTFANPNAASTTATFSVAGTYTLRLTGSDSSLTSTDDVVVTVNSAAPTLANRTDLIYSSEIGEWEHTTSTPPFSSAVVSQATAAKVPMVRYAVGDCFTDMTCGTDNHTGTTVRSQFDGVVQGITGSAAGQYHAALWLKMAPLDSGVIDNNVNQTVFCPPWTGDASGNLAMYEAAIAEVKAAGYTGPLVIESNNEMEYDCWSLWKAQGAAITSAGSVGVSARIGDHYAATMPALKAYARGLGFTDLMVGGYLGVGGGTNWGQSCTADVSKPFGYACTYQSRWVSEFNTSVHNAYVAAGSSNPDYIPDFEAIHAYPHSADFTSTAGYAFDDNIAFAYYRNWITQSRSVVDGIWGATVGDPVRFSISEWNAGASNTGGTWSGWTTSGAPGTFYDGWFGMLRGDGVTTGTGTRYWEASLFEIAGNSDTGSGQYYNIIKQDGTTPAWYTNYKTASTSGL